MKKIIFLCLICFSMAWVPIAGAQLYHWIDENGVKRFSNEPPPEGVEIIDKEKEIKYDRKEDRDRHAEDERIRREVERMRQERAAEVDAAAQERRAAEAAERQRIEREQQRLEAEKKAKQEKRRDEGTWAQKQRRRERASQGSD